MSTTDTTDLWAQYRDMDDRKMAKVKCAQAARRAAEYRAQGDERRASKAWEQALRWDAIACGIAEARDECAGSEHP